MKEVTEVDDDSKLRKQKHNTICTIVLSLGIAETYADRWKNTFA